MTDAQAAEDAPSPPAPPPTCQSCGVSEDDPDSTLSRASMTASKGLKSLPRASLDWLVHTYGVVPSCLCAACFIPALTNANNAWWATQQAPA